MQHTTSIQTKFRILSSTLAASVLAFSAQSQDSAIRAGAQTETVHSDVTQAARSGLLNSAAKASDILGMTVNNYQGEKLGKVEELAILTESGRILQVIISTGGFLGVGDTLTAVPPEALHHDLEKGVLHLDATKEKIKSAPVFVMSNWHQCCEKENVSSVYRHFGSESTHGIARHEATNRADALRDQARELDQDAANAKDRSGIRDSQIPVEGAVKYTQYIGSTVKNLEGDTLGKVENLLLDLSAGRVIAVVVSSGGFLGIGDELSAVPPGVLRSSPDNRSLVLDASKETLSQAPHFKAGEWPDFSGPAYTDSLYRAYGYQPYSKGNPTHSNSDNSNLNPKVTWDRAFTAVDQGTSEADMATTAKVRKEIVDAKDFSTTARNVKVATHRGIVTLRGPVDTTDEKRRIGAIAIEIAQAENVNNQIRVK